MIAAEQPAGLLQIGRCGKPHGVRGDIAVLLSSDRTERLAPGSQLWIGEWMEVSSSRPVPGSDRWIVSFAGVTDRNAAEGLVNRIVWGRPLEDENALWVHQLIDAEVRDVHGTVRGRCRSVIANPANDLLELDNGALVPVTFVTSVSGDEASGFVVVVDPPSGLFELFDESSSTGER